jgi:hypothetical protein
MGSIVHAFCNVVKSAAQITEDAVQASIKAGVAVAGLTVKLGGSVLKAASPVTKIYAGAMKYTLDNTLGRVLPPSIYSKMASFTNAGASMAEGNLTSANFRAVVKGFVDQAMIGVRINNEALLQFNKTGLSKTVNKYTGGILTSVTHLGKVAVVMENNALTDNYEKIDWVRTLIEVVQVAAAVSAAIATGGMSMAIASGTTIVGNETGLNKSKLGMGILTAGAMMASGTADFSQVATTGATQLGTTAVINNTSLGDSQLGRTALELGATATANSIQGNTAFTTEFRNLAEKKAKEIATVEANKKLKDITGLPLNVNMLTSAYDVMSGDKTMEQIAIEAKENFVASYDKAVAGLSAKLENLTEEEVKKQATEYATREADKYVLDQLEQAKNKYGAKLFDYLLDKYGPKTDYADVIVPDDYLNYQIFTPDPNKRIVNIVYKQNTAKIVGGVLAVGIVGLAVAYSV